MMLILQISLLQSLHGGHRVERVAVALFIQLTKPPRWPSDFGVVITLLACYNSILRGRARSMCIEIWLVSLTFNILGVRSVLASESLTSRHSLEIVTQLH